MMGGLPRAIQWIITRIIFIIIFKIKLLKKLKNAKIKLLILTKRSISNSNNNNLIC